jgi:hypothetical protein
MKPDYYNLDGYEADTLDDAIKQIVDHTIECWKDLPVIECILTYTNDEEAELSPAEVNDFNEKLHFAYGVAVVEQEYEWQHICEISSLEQMGRV